MVSLVLYVSAVEKRLIVPSLGFMSTFFSKMGIKDLRFKPAYNPYTEVRSQSLRLPRYLSVLIIPFRSSHQWKSSPSTRH